MSPEFFQLAYISAATSPFDAERLRQLLIKARAKNRRLGISGLLIHADGSFLQVLEGSPKDVLSLFDRIATDPRHHRVLQVFASAQLARNFEDWTMGYVAEDPGLKSLPGFNDFLNAGFARTGYTPELATRIRDLALQFRAGRWRRSVDEG